MSEIEITRGPGISSRIHHQFHHSLEQACFLAEFYGFGYVVKTSPLLAGTRFEALRSIEALEWQQRGLWPEGQPEILLRVQIIDEGFVVKSFSEGVRLVVSPDRRRVDVMIDQRMFGLEVDDEADHEEIEESDDEVEEDEGEDYSTRSDDADDEDSDDVEAEDETDEDTVIDAVSPSLSLRVGLPDEMLYRRLSSLQDSNMEDEGYSYSTDDGDDSDTTEEDDSEDSDEDDSEDSDEDDYDEAREPVNRENEERWIQWVRQRTETETAESMLEMFRKTKTDQEYRNYCLALNDEECRVFQTILDRSHWLKEFDAGDAPYAETAARRARWQRAVFADNKCESEGPETAATPQYSSQHPAQFSRQIWPRNE